MYTTKKGTLPNENALLKILYLRVKELDQKWSSGNVPNLVNGNKPAFNQ